MAGIYDLLNSDMGLQLIGGLSQESNQPEDKTASVLSMAMPLLIGAMKRNANSPQGADGLMDALNNKHDGGILDNLSGLFSGGVNDDVKVDGLGILGHILGGSQDNVVGAVSKKSGMDTNGVMQILQVAAPVLLGMLGKQKQNVSSSNGIGDLLGSLMGVGSEQPKQQSLIESILDGDNDGSVIDDIAGMVLGGSNSNKSSGGLGGLLGGVFGGK
ncbi:DUF937 domain-containing protein [Patiriisocius sp. Uisw_017]|jgi:hypothetical protein|uniref:DUF937 domain-containing protein n=1 Tax=Patiriisocius sp. Uisw_017 TaxID=3230968 RepID=UPI0039EAF3A9